MKTEIPTLKHGGSGLEAIDFAELYRRQAAASTLQPRRAEDWDQRAERRSRHEKGSDYTREFLERVNFDGVRTVLDIGCGTGNLALPLARRLQRVHALDFSGEMLRLLRKNARTEGIGNIVTHKLAWADEWKSVPRADAVICSRAMAVDDLHAALAKMTAHARLRCYLTLHAEGTFMSPEVYRVLHRPVIPRPNYLYAVNLLWQMGFRARVDFLRTRGGLLYESADPFIEGIRWRVGHLSPAEENRLGHWFNRLPKRADGTALYEHDFIWAFLSWEVPAPASASSRAHPRL